MYSLDAWGRRPVRQTPLHAPASNESDEKMWKVSLHQLKEFGSMLNIRAVAVVQYKELQ